VITNQRGNWLTLRASVNQRLDTVFRIFFPHLHQGRIDPSPRGNRIEAGNNDIELLVERLCMVLDFAVITTVLPQLVDQ